MKYRERVLKQQELGAICAHAVQSVIESFGEDSRGADWAEFQALADSAPESRDLN